MRTLANTSTIFKSALSEHFIHHVLPAMVREIEREWLSLRRDAPPSEDNEVDCLLRISHHCLGRLLNEAE